MTVEQAKFSSKIKSLFKSAPLTSANAAPIVETRNGALRGRRVQLDGGRAANAFLGIPYARPPVGALRFRKPELSDEKWKGIRSARHYGHRAVQRDFFWNALTEFRVGKSEDCLHLNVVAPAAAPDSVEFPSGYAVMVYIHGGGFVMDSAAKYHYRNLASGDENSVGNYGLWDQVLALRWIRDNIASFGGDSRRVTVFGQSAGAVSADLLSIMPESRDLMQQVILMGGNAEAIWAISPKRHLVRYCRQKAVQLGFRPRGTETAAEGVVNALADASADVWTCVENAHMMNFLRSQPARKFESTIVGDRSVLGKLRIPITPVFDGDLLPASVAQMRADAPPRRAIVGVSEFEGLLFLALCLQRVNRKFLNYCETQAIEVLGGTAGAAAHKFRQQYGITEKSRRDKRFVKRACVDMVSDLVTNFALENYSRRMTANGSTVWRYVFEHYNPAATRALNLTMPFVGATHCTELIYLFDLNMFVVPFWRTRADRCVNALVTRLWTNFAKYGDPNGPLAKDRKNTQNIRSSNEASKLEIRQNPLIMGLEDPNYRHKTGPELMSLSKSRDLSMSPSSNSSSSTSRNAQNDKDSGIELISAFGVSSTSNRSHYTKFYDSTLWLPYATDGRAGHYVIAEQPAFCESAASAVWQRAHILAPHADSLTRYDA